MYVNATLILPQLSPAPRVLKSILYVYVFIPALPLIFEQAFYLFIYFWLCWVFAAARRLSLVAASGATVRCRAQAYHCGGFSLLRSTGSRHVGFSSCGSRASVVVAHGL